MDNHPILSLPPGDLIISTGTRFHLQKRYSSVGLPNLLFETGLTMMSSVWGWLAPELASTANLFLYDRAGLGWSEERAQSRSVHQLALELRHLLLAANIQLPVIMLGHSMGALLQLAYSKLYPSDISALIWLDPAHPEQMIRGKSTRARMKAFFFTLEAASLFASRNLPRLERPFLPLIDGLPSREFEQARFFFQHPRHLRAAVREAREWEESCSFVRGTELGDLPLLIISAQKKSMKDWSHLQNELSRLSTRSKHLTFTDASHLSLLTHRDHSARVASEIRSFIHQHKLAAPQA